MKDPKKFKIRPELLALRAEVISVLESVDLNWLIQYRINVDHADAFVELSEFVDLDTCKRAVSALRKRFKYALDMVLRHDGWCILIWPRGVGYRVGTEGNRSADRRSNVWKDPTDAQLFEVMDRLDRIDAVDGDSDDGDGDENRSPECAVQPDLHALAADMPWLRGLCDHKRGCIIAVPKSQAELFGLMVALQAHWQGAVKILKSHPGPNAVVELWPNGSGWQVVREGKLLPFATPMPSPSEIEAALASPPSAAAALHAAAKETLEEIAVAFDPPAGGGKVPLDIAVPVVPTREMDAALYARAVRRVLLAAPVVLIVTLEPDGNWAGDIKLEMAAGDLGIDRREMRRLCNYLQHRRWLIDGLADLVVRERLDEFAKFTVGEQWEQQYERAVGLTRHRHWGLVHSWDPPSDRLVLIGHVSALSAAINERLLEECAEGDGL